MFNFIFQFMSKKRIYTLFIIAIALSAVSLTVSFVRIEPVTWDGLGGLAGILSILVTLLLGWQIFYAIDIEKRMQSIVNRELFKTKDEIANVLHKYVINNNIITNAESLKYYITNREWSRVVSLCSRLIEDYIKINDRENLEQMIETLEELYKTHGNEIQKFQTIELIKSLKKSMSISDKALNLLCKINTQ